MNNYLASMSLVVTVLLGAYVFTHQTAPVVKEINTGALSSPDIASPYLSFGGVRFWAATQSPTAASSTVCSIQSPAATTTLEAATVRIDSSAAYLVQYELGKATTNYATTSRLALFDIAANAQAAIIATTTTSGGVALTNVTDNIIAPNSFINLRISTSTASAAFAPTGRCSAVFREI